MRAIRVIISSRMTLRRRPTSHSHSGSIALVGVAYRYTSGQASLSNTKRPTSSSRSVRQHMLSHEKSPIVSSYLSILRRLSHSDSSMSHETGVRRMRSSLGTRSEVMRRVTWVPMSSFFLMRSMEKNDFSSHPKRSSPHGSVSIVYWNISE
jgi:hypothetical protein